ncbi:uncharacterized protein LOC110826033 [Carica papaya]|uniref:uncharacterized protein LOC110826033 n=1 Tax=Carica papaya TaxID=3649 RepID=UPI000B8CB58B|nr:uncharacterized protein LOC110826033 [Carica papaya]
MLLQVRCALAASKIYELTRVPVKFISSNVNQDSFTVSYLVNSCGLSPASALLASKKVHFETPDKPDLVISFFKKHGFSQTQISNLVRKLPSVLLCKPGKTLLPKLNFFYSQGFSRTDLARILSRDPIILKRSLNACIIRNFNFYKKLIHYNDKIIQASKRHPGILYENFQSVEPVIALLREHGVPQLNIQDLLVSRPEFFRRRQDVFRKVVEKVKEMGFDPSKATFVSAVQALTQMSRSTWDSKWNLYRDLGWSDKEVALAFGRIPQCMMLSADNIKRTVDFYVNKMGVESSFLAKRPFLLSLSFEKRIVPRYSVFEVLSSKGLIQKGFNVISFFESPEKEFLKKFVIRYEDETPHLSKLYQEKLGSPRASCS